MPKIRIWQSKTFQELFFLIISESHLDNPALRFVASVAYNVAIFIFDRSHFIVDIRIWEDKFYKVTNFWIAQYCLKVFSFTHRLPSSGYLNKLFKNTQLTLSDSLISITTDLARSAGSLSGALLKIFKLFKLFFGP